MFLSSINIGSLPELGGCALEARGASSRPSLLCEPSFSTDSTNRLFESSSLVMTVLSGTCRNLLSLADLSSEQADNKPTAKKHAASKQLFLNRNRVEIFGMLTIIDALSLPASPFCLNGRTVCALCHQPMNNKEYAFFILDNALSALIF